MSKSWFYLTLWHGTPPEFTEELDADIETTDTAFVKVKTIDSTDAMIETVNAEEVDINMQSQTDAEIIIVTGVVWSVG